MTCPGKTAPLGVCSDHGRCLKMEELAEYAQRNGDAISASYGMTPNKAATWDFDKIYGCMCDEGWQGYDCALKVCPTGDDVTTTGQTDERQSFVCRYVGTVPAAGPPNFRLKFRQQVTSPIAYNAPSAAIQSALEELSTIGRLEVVFSGGKTEACTIGAGTEITFLFDTENGDVPPLTIVSNEGFTQGTDLVFAGDPSDPMKGREVAKGTTENEECSGRGICDHKAGQCRCFEGFGSSDGSGKAGGIDDCGYREPYNAPPKANKYNTLWSTPKP